MKMGYSNSLKNSKIDRTLQVLRVYFFFCILMVISGCSSYHTLETVKPMREKVEKLEPVRLPKVAIDAGHGGKDLGAQSTIAPKSQEKALTLSTALYLNEALQKMGHPTLLTRGKDLFVPLKVRTDFANANDAGLFISVHFNSAPNKGAEGVEIYYYESETNRKRTDLSKTLAEKVLQKIINRVEMKSRGVKKGNFAVIRETEMPAILIEGGFLTNDQEAARLADSRTLRAIAESIALGIKEYYTQK